MTQTAAKDMMKKDPVIISPDSTLREAAEKMASIKCGALPVGSNDKIEGMITDRDIVVRAVAKGKDPAKEQVRDYMTPEICSCKEDDTTETIAELMGENNVSRVLVEDEDGRPSGIITFGHIIRKNDNMDEIVTAIEFAARSKAA